MRVPDEVMPYLKLVAGARRTSVRHDNLATRPKGGGNTDVAYSNARTIVYLADLLGAK